MSRRHTANVRGALEVELVCDECGRRAWRVVAIDDCDDCAEYKAVNESPDWGFADDALVCSSACESRFWDGAL